MTPLAPLAELAGPLKNKLFGLQLTEITTAEWIAVAQEYGMRVGLVLIVIYLAFSVAGWSSSVVQKSLARLRFDATLTKFLAKFARWSVLLFAGLCCLSYFGVEVASFAAIIGAAGLAVGLAFQGTLSNFAAGAMLLIFRPFRVGDLVNVAGYLGKVDEIELFTTSIDTLDNRRIIIPNSAVFGAVIENVTHNHNRRVDVPVGVSYRAEIDATRSALASALVAIPGALREPSPEVVLAGLGSSSVDWMVHVWAPTSEYRQVKQETVRAVKLALDRAGIEIPFPQMDLHLRTVPGEPAKDLLSGDKPGRRWAA